MTIKKELTVVTGTYTAKDGSTKKRYQLIGHIHEGQHGDYITLNPLMNLAAVPRKEGDDRVYVNMFDPKPKQGAAPAPAAAADDSSDVPF